MRCGLGLFVAFLKMNPHDRSCLRQTVHPAHGQTAKGYTVLSHYGDIALQGREPPCTESAWCRVRGAGGCGTCDLNSHRVGRIRDLPGYAVLRERTNTRPARRSSGIEPGPQRDRCGWQWLVRTRRRSLFEPGEPVRKAGSPGTMRWSGGQGSSAPLEVL